jgi:8-oxo-dGTP diphosphatase
LQRYRISAGAIIEDHGRVLLVRHVVPGRYDFWVAPGGGVKDEESYEEAATREVWEETGLNVKVGRLLYIEDLVNPECRIVKFWFAARLIGGTFDVTHPEAKAEHVVEAAWLRPEEFRGKAVFPDVLTGRFASDKEAGFPEVIRLPMRRMDFW